MNTGRKGAKATARPFTLQTLSKLLLPPDQRSFSQDELLSVLFIWRIVVAVIAAVACGTLPATGWMPPAVFFLASILSTVMFYKGYLQIDEDEFGGKSQLLADGSPLSMCAFMVTWIVTYSTAHF